jgi:hypothetical protein
VVTGQPIGPDAAEQQEHDHRELPRCEHEPEVGLRSRQVEDCEGKPDRRDRTAEDRDGPAEEEQAELALGKWAEPVQEAGASRLSQ